MKDNTVPYGKNAEEIISEAVEKIAPNRFKDYTFLGQRQLIDEIFIGANCEIESTDVVLDL